MPSWRPIGSGTAAALTVTVPAGAQRVRVYWVGNNSTDAFLRARINNDATASLHVRSQTILSPSGTITEVEDGVAGTEYRVGAFQSTLQSWGDFDLNCTATNVPMSAHAYRQGIPAGSIRYISYGILAAARTVTSIVLSPAAGTLSAFEWRAEGYFV